MSKRDLAAGFTLMEVVVCVAIIAVVAAIVFPVAASAKRAAQVTVTKSNLRQIWFFLEMYRQDCDGASDVGNAYDLRLPPSDFYTGSILPKLGLKPPLAGRWSGMGWYYYYPPDPQYAHQELLDEWIRYSNACGPGANIVADLNFSDYPITSGSPYEARRGIGITLGGQLIDRETLGSPLFYEWWGCGAR